MNQLEQARQSIDAIDKQMAALFEQRMQAVGDVAAYKAAHNLPILDEGREQAVVEKNLALLTDQTLAPFYAQYITHQMAVSRQYQAQILGRDKVAFQGVEGAFSHIALTHLFPNGKAVACTTFAEVFAAVSSGAVSYGVVPFENSHAGDVSAVLDLCFAHSDIYINAVYDLPVCQNLLGLPGASVSGIRRVLSHPQAIAQSTRFLQSLNLCAEECLNTAVAAKQVAEGGDASVAAIASAETAALYGLDILANNINSDGDNTTRFIVIGKHLPTAGDRFSLLFTVNNKAGTLAKVIATIGEAGVNMECIKSRPMPGVPFEYYFYAELEGNPTQQKALTEALQDVCNTLHVLGIFKREQ